MERRHFENNRHVKLGGLGKWREYYLSLLRDEKFDQLLEIGSGTPEFLQNFNYIDQRIAIDLNKDLNQLYQDQGIEIHNVDLETFQTSDLNDRHFDYIICSDVFEHLINPLQTLETCSELTSENGCLISHVPNEFQFRHIISVMLGRKNTVAFFDSDEWDSPHVRFFTNVGYKKFLKQFFEYNIPLNKYTYGPIKRKLLNFNILPYTFQSGPTYLSTNNFQKYTYWIEKLAG